MSTNPFSKPDIERALLGGLIFDAERIGETEETLNADDFCTPVHRRLFHSLCSLSKSNAAIDPTTIVDWLSSDKEARSNPPKGGWHVFVGDVMADATTSAFVPYHCRVLSETTLLRNLAEVLHTGADDAGRVHAGVETETDDFIDHIEGRIHTIAQRRLAGAEIVDVARLAPSVREELLRGEKSRGLNTGIVDLDDLLLGMTPDEVILVAARPSKGKTSLVLQIALNTARHGKSILFLSLEMSRQELMERMLANLGSIDSSSIRSRCFTDGDRQRLAQASNELERMNISLVEGSATTVARLRGLARRHLRQRGLDLIVVDYLQLMSDPGRKDRVQEVSAISRGLKALARELHVPVIAVSQLSRAGDGGRPHLSHLRDSGALEQDADVVAMLWSDDEYSPLHCSVEKNRHGRTGVTRLAFIREHYRIAGLSRERTTNAS